MTLSPNKNRDRTFTLVGLVSSVAIALFLSPLASQNPDGLDRVAQDLQFEEKAVSEPPAQKLPFYQWFDEYALRGVPEPIAMPLAGLMGTVVTFGLAWGLGKVVVRQQQPKTAVEPELPDSEN